MLSSKNELNGKILNVACLRIGHDFLQKETKQSSFWAPSPFDTLDKALNVIVECQSNSSSTFVCVSYTSINLGIF